MCSSCNKQKTPRSDRCNFPRERQEVRAARAEAQRRFRRMEERAAERRAAEEEREAQQEEEEEVEEEPPRPYQSLVRYGIFLSEVVRRPREPDIA